MRLSPFHKELAKLMASGLPNREIKKRFQICDSRLSVLRSNPVMRREVDRYRALEDSKYAKAIEVFKDNAEQVAEKLVSMVVNDVNVKDSLRLKTAEVILERLADAEGVQKTRDAGETQELVFEQMLRVSKRGGQEDAAEDESAILELEEDFTREEEIVDDIIDVEPLSIAEPRQDDIETSVIFRQESAASGFAEINASASGPRRGPGLGESKVGEDKDAKSKNAKKNGKVKVHELSAELKRILGM